DDAGQDAPAVGADATTCICNTLGEIMLEVGLGRVQRYRAIDRDNSLMVSLIERWDPATNVFHLPTGEMTITLED
ncbi:hypothetical protein KI387_013344, partial [Taxus chinensis]